MSARAEAAAHFKEMFPEQADLIVDAMVLPDIQVHAVRGQKIYATLEDPLGVQTVVVLDVPKW